MAKKSIHIQEVNTTIVDENGEMVNKTTKNVGMFEKEPPYVKTYISDIQRLVGLPSFVNDVLLELLHNMGYNNIVPMYMPIKQMICNKLNISINTLNKSIDELYKKGILIRAARGMYLMDPNAFGRGTWNEIKNIRMTIEYKEDGTRTIKTEFQNKIKQAQQNPNQLGIFSISNDEQ
jgi:hypothetical protein